MHYKLSVKGIIKRGDGKILIIRRGRDDNHKPGIWETVGGGMDGEYSPQEALKREVREEVGLEVKVLEPFNVFSFIKDDGEMKIGITFLCEYVSGEVILSDEHSEFAWIKALDFKNYESVPSLHSEMLGYANKYNDEHEKFAVSQKAILIRDNKCLIAEASNWPGVWDLPGGRVNVGENKEEAFRREIKEELGLEKFHILSTVHYDVWHNSIGYAICGVANLIEADEDIVISDEHTNHLWITEEEVDKYKFLWPSMGEMIKKGFYYIK